MSPDQQRIMPDYVEFRLNGCYPWLWKGGWGADFRKVHRGVRAAGKACVCSGAWCFLLPAYGFATGDYDWEHISYAMGCGWAVAIRRYHLRIVHGG
jgi:hypothetical protein